MGLEPILSPVVRAGNLEIPTSPVRWVPSAFDNTRGKFET